MTRSKVYLLDSNVLIALATPEHSQNQRAAAWYRKGHPFATCPITQGALVRFHLRAGVDATAESAKLLLKSISSLPRHQFWPDDASYLDMPITGIIGHRQVTDAYLALLARKHGGSLATMDRALAAVHAAAILIKELLADSR
jgi:toxin-antitoxin system PIN domain toxin